MSKRSSAIALALTVVFVAVFTGMSGSTHGQSAAKAHAGWEYLVVRQFEGVYSAQLPDGKGITTRNKSGDEFAREFGMAVRNESGEDALFRWLGLQGWELVVSRRSSPTMECIHFKRPIH